jgi:hypothetical protein
MACGVFGIHNNRSSSTFRATSRIGPLLLDRFIGRYYSLESCTASLVGSSACNPSAACQSPSRGAVRELLLSLRRHCPYQTGPMRKLRVSSGPVSVLTRLLPASGMLAAVVLALTGLISPPPPLAGSQASDIVTYYASHRVGLEIESIADGLGIILLVIFAATFHARIRSGLSMTAFGAAAIVAATTLVQVAAFHALAYRPNPDPVRATLLNDFQSFTFQVTTFPSLLFLGAAGAAILASGELPRWLGLAAIVAAGLQAISWISFFAPPGILAAGAVPDIVSFGALLGWLVACSVAMLVQYRHPAHY